MNFKWSFDNRYVRASNCQRIIHLNVLSLLLMNWKQTIFVFVPPIQLRTRVQVTSPTVERLDVVDLYDAGDP